MPATAPPKGKVTAQGVFAELNTVKPILDSHTQYFAPKLQTALKDRVEYIIPKLKIKTENPEQLEAISTQVAQGATAHIFANIGRIQETEQIPQVIADSIATTIDADPRLKTDKIDKEKIYQKAEESAEEIAATHAPDLENAATLGDINNIRSLGGPNPPAQAEVEYQIDDYIAETQDDNSQVSKNALMGNVAGFTQNYISHVSKNLSTELSSKKIPTFERLQEIKNQSFELAAADIAQNTGKAESVQVAQKVGLSLGLATPTPEHIESVGLGTTQPNPLTFANAVGSQSADVGIQLANRGDFQNKAYLFLLASHPQFDKTLQEETAKLQQLRSQPATYQNILAQRRQENLLKTLQSAKSETQKSPREKQKMAAFFGRLQGGLPRASRHVWHVTRTYFDRTPAFYVPQSLVTERVLYSRAIGSMPVAFNIPNTNSGASTIMRLPGLIRGGTRSFKTARSAIGAAKAAGTAARVGATAAEATNPVGWALLAAQFAPAIQKLFKKAAMAVGAIIAYLIAMFGLKILGLIAGLGFGAVTGIPILFLVPFPFSIPVYLAWVGFWGYYGWSNPLAMLNITMHPLAAISNVLHSVTSFVSNAFGAASNIGSTISSVFTGGTPAGAVVAPAAGATTGAAIGFLVGGPIGAAIGAGIGYLLTGGFGHIKNIISFTTGASPAAVGGFFGAVGSFLTGTAAAIWGGLSGAGGAALGFLGNVGGAIWGGLSGVGVSASAALTPVAATVGAITTVGLIGGTITAATFFNPEPESSNQLILAENEFFAVTKSTNRPTLENTDLPATVTFTITLRAKDTSLTAIGITDRININGEFVNNFSIAPQLGPECANPPEQLEPQTSWSCNFNYEIRNSDSRVFDNSLLINTVTIAANPEGAERLTSSASTSVTIGDPPADCPRGWPTTGDITQGPEGRSSHAENSVLYNGIGMESLDIAGGIGVPVYATFNGTVMNINRPESPLNKVINIAVTGCGDLTLVSYIHLKDVNVAASQQVTFGQLIGTQGNPGGGAHLHYQFNQDNNRSVNIIDYIPVSIPRNCDDAFSPVCDVIISPPVP